MKAHATQVARPATKGGARAPHAPKAKAPQPFCGDGGSNGPALPQGDAVASPRIRVHQRELLTAARIAADNAYAPYSHFLVGAALLADDGRIFSGANVENASYGLTVCAERPALFTAVNAGARRFRALALVAGEQTPATPCGACRQVLAEFCTDRMPIFCATHSGSKTQRTTLGKLLPQAFRMKAVKS